MRALWPVDIVALNPVSCGSVLWRIGGVLRVTILVKATFAFGAGDGADLVAPEPVEREDRFHDDDPSRSLRSASDTAPYLPGAGVVLTGHAHASDATGPVIGLSARLALFRGGPLLDKTIHVFGDPTPGSIAPTPFQRMPLVYERAAGGPSHPWNPVGVSEAGEGALDPAMGPRRARPNLVNPASSHRPACFGPIAPHWPLRKRLFNGFEPGATRRSAQLGSPGADPAAAGRAEVLDLPADFDFRAFNPAPFDQQIPFLQGDESIILENLSAGRAFIWPRLPSARARVRRYRIDAERAGGSQEIPLVADTLVIDGDRQIASLVWRGNFATESEEALQGIRLFAGVETLKESIPWPEHGASLPGDPAATHRSSAPAVLLAKPIVAPAGLVETGPLSKRKMEMPVLPFRDSPAAPQPPADLAVSGGITGPLGQRMPIPEDRLAEVGAERAQFPVAAPGTSASGGEDPIPGAPWSPMAAPRPVSPAGAGGSQPGRTLVDSGDPASGVVESAPPPEPDAEAAPAEASSGATLVAREPSGQEAAYLAVEAAPPEKVSPQLEMAPPALVEVALPERVPPPERRSRPPEEESPAAVSPPVTSEPLTGLEARKRAEARLAEGGDFDGDDLSGGDLSGLDFSGRSLARCALRGARLRGARLAGASLVEATLDEADLRGADLSRADLTNARADRAELVEASLEEADLRGASLRGANLERARLGRARGDGATLSAANLAGADLEDARFVGASFAGANLRDAKADRADFMSARLDRADLGAASFCKARLVAAVLAHAKLDLTDLRGANLERANLHGASRRRAKIAGANMKEIDETAPVRPEDPEGS
ncbi:DUF2169 family type VI secretion system accessory protein [Sorangium sp. So ce204]|uniref:DUF2169 family type VI secretion system accessory protein n=1 Tax=Sorangium sp. So ce204 TaxID=3133288 RepID=UPI003F60EBE2